MTPLLTVYVIIEPNSGEMIPGVNPEKSLRRGCEDCSQDGSQSSLLEVGI